MMSETDWDIVKARLISCWPRGQGGWPESTLAVWRQELEEAGLDGESVYAAVRELSRTSTHAPAMADLIREAKVLRAKQRQQASRAMNASEPGLLPEGVLAIMQTNLGVVALVDGRGERVPPDPATLAGGRWPEDSTITAIEGSQEAVQRMVEQQAGRVVIALERR